MASAVTDSWALVAGVGAVVLLLTPLIQWVLSTLRPRAFPPGPPVVPGLGNLLQIPVQKSYLKFSEWSKQYGDIIGLKIGAGNLVVLSDPTLIHELWDKRGAIYSDRPKLYVFSKHLSADGEEEPQIVVAQYNDYYRRARKALHSVAGEAGIKRVLPLLEAEACSLVCKLLDDDSGYAEHLKHWSLAVPLVAAVGERLKDMPPGYMRSFFHAQEELLNTNLPGTAPPVDIFPILRYMPEFLASWKKRARAARELIVRDANTIFEGGRKQFHQIERDPKSVKFQSLLAKAMLDQKAEKSKDKRFTDKELGFIGQAFAGAAADTTTGVLTAMMMAFAAYPRVLAKAQEEADRVGGGRPPGSDQLGELVYLRACLTEMIRWRPTVPAGIPHVLRQDDQFGEYFFPKGTMFLLNAWAIHHNEAEYERPDEFMPERFLDNPYGTRSSISQKSLEKSGRRALYAFGSGRRICPGEQFGHTNLLLTAAKIVWAYNVLAPPGGVDLSIETGFFDNTVTTPVNPRVVFRLRDEKRREGLVEDLARAEAISKELLGDV
ncbi:cytochrome P450 [Xylariaceae sp. FL0804]|nr:cytochrome P450 [Xylariaceae sp. FL0804]